VKTLETSTTARIANPRQVYYSLKTNIDELANFDEATLGTKTVTSSEIHSRALNVAIPSGATNAELAQIDRAIQYAASQGVTLKITVVNP
jgi:filamentous hemagglutinin